MTELMGVSRLARMEDAMLAPDSRAALIVAHVERLAKEANSPQTAATCRPGFVRQVIAARAARRQYFESDLFADPAWDILLELYVLRCEQRRTSVSKLCIAAAVPSTTALRWLDKLQADGLVDRQPDVHDGRRVWVAMSDKGFEAVQSYLQQLGGALAI